MYVLVLLTERPGVAEPPPEHEGTPSVGYVLRCGSLADARAITASDPLVSSGAFDASVAAWDLVAIDPRLVDPDLVVG